MKKITQKYPADESNRVFTENINYFDTDKESIWGKGEPETIEAIKNTDIHGKWLNIAAGDGRYSRELLEKADILIAGDIDEGALSKLWHQTPENLRNKLQTVTFDVNEKFPFAEGEFDGVFCTGFLHLFGQENLQKIFAEIKRVLKTDGKIFFDFATDIKRTDLGGKEIIKYGRRSYKLNEAKELFLNSFPNFDLQITDAKLTEGVQEANPPYVLTCNFLIVVGRRT